MLNAGFVCFLTTANWVSFSLYNLQLIGPTGQTNISFAGLIAVFCLFGRFFAYLVVWLDFLGGFWYVGWVFCLFVLFAPLKVKLIAFTWCCTTELQL